MKYDPIDVALFIKNRKILKKSLKPKSIAVFNANDVMPTNADGAFPFVQQTDLFYLTGIDQEETMLLICPDALEKEKQEILFIQETNQDIAVWQGERYSKARAAELSGIKTIYWTREFPQVFKQLLADCETIYLNTNEHPRADSKVETRDARFLKWCQGTYPLHHYERLSPILHHLRAIKSDTEIQLIRHACRITEKAFQRVLSFVRPGVWEFEVEAEIVHEFLKNRSNGPAYFPVIASGENTCVLHYAKNDRQCQDGDLLLMDFGAEYAHYASDVTRTIPVNGRFSNRQRAVYNAVLRIQKAAIQLLRSGNTMEKYTAQVGRHVQEELIGLGLIRAKDIKTQLKEKPLYKEFFMHGVSHHLGLDVHDYGHRHRKFEPGMVLTCEPGIYIPREALGIRLENDILITENGPMDLTKDVPIEAEEIEALMSR